VHQYYFGEPQRIVPIDAALAKEIQSALARLGFHRGPATGAFDPATRQALVDFQGWENLEGRIREGAEIDALVLDHLRKRAREAPAPR